MKWNFCAFIVGPPEYGKTTIARALVRRHMTEMPNPVVLVHDPVNQFAKDGCKFFKDANAWRAAAAEAAKKKQPISRGASLGGSDEEIMRLALDVGQRAGNNQDNVRVQILVVRDEASLATGSGATHMGATDNELLATRRHRGVGIVFNLQDPSQLTSRFFRMGTDFYLLAQTTRAAAKLDELLFLEPGTLMRAGVTQLPKHKYLHVKQREGVVRDAL
jgi:hypothetical protein